MGHDPIFSHTHELKLLNRIHLDRVNDEKLMEQTWICMNLFETHNKKDDELCGDWF